MNADGRGPRELRGADSTVTTARAFVTGANGCALAPARAGGAAGLLGFVLSLLALRRRSRARTDGKGETKCA